MVYNKLLYINQYNSLLSTKLFSARRYFSCPSRSNHLRQKARVPKFLLITFSSCFDLANLEKYEQYFISSQKLSSHKLVDPLQSQSFVY